MSLLDSIEEAEQINTALIGSNVTYTVTATNISTPDLKCLPEDAEYGVYSEDGTATYDQRYFLSIKLASKPVKGDKIEFNGEVWYVLTYKSSGTSIYDIECEANKKKTNLRVGRTG